MATLDDAILLAARAHHGQRDRAGSPYILHSLRMMLRMESDTERMVAVLHDVVEKTPLTLADLVQAGYSEQVVEAVDRLTRREGESYDQLIERARGNPLACAVKIADLEDHMDLRWSGELLDKDLDRLSKYRQAWLYLTENRAGADCA
jgi:(p)ppGpp synthase/HD superfamily hydrolase